MEELNTPNPVASQPQPQLPPQPQVVLIKEQKSVGTALLLTILFGPLGLLYVSVAGGLVLSLLSVLLFWTVIVPVICWIAAVIWAAVGIKNQQPIVIGQPTVNP